MSLFFIVCALIENKRDGRLGELSTEFDGCPIGQERIDHVRIIGRVPAALGRLSSGEAYLGHITM